VPVEQLSAMTNELSQFNLLDVEITGTTGKQTVLPKSLLSLLAQCFRNSPRRDVRVAPEFTFSGCDLSQIAFDDWIDFLHALAHVGLQWEFLVRESSLFLS
jgi:hypothetical protein